MQHTDIPTRSDVETLATTREPGCVSIYLPTSSLPSETEQARIQLKNLVRTATEQLVAAGTDEKLVAAITDSVDTMVADRDFWRYLSNSLAIFVNGSGIRSYRLPNRLIAVSEVSDRFYIKPLLRSITFPQSAFILALAQNSVRLIEVSADLPANRLTIPDMPTDVASAVGLESIKGRSPDGREGRLQGTEGQKVRMREYAQSILRAIRPTVVNSSRPLIIAGAEPLTGIYRSVSTFPRLSDTVIAGNPEDRSDDELAAAARPILDDLYASELAELADRFGTDAAHGRAVTDLTDVARAATSNAIDTLLFDIDHKVSGTIDDETGAVTLVEHDDAVHYGVIDEIVRRALLSDARVFAVRAEQVPSDTGVAAVLRFPA